MVKPKKHLGQHFLTDPNTALKIVNYLPENTLQLLEIGPGKGILTKFILQKNIPDFKLIELDAESVEYLLLNFPELAGKIYQHDFLKFDLKQLFDGKWTIIGNFPYNISSQILFRVLEFRNSVNVVVGMFQKEVAERIAASPGNKTYGILSVLTQAYYKIEYLATIREGVFFPPPKVKSAVIRLTRNDVENLDCDESLFFGVVKTAFNQRRKTLRNALGKMGVKDIMEIQEFMEKRAEQLSVNDFIKITSFLSIQK
ncbi:MAG TPA: 16S rRNA (adenine(1518)-N(6)/adenine(1519)-N(6))-dimethyltransferase RsmA [Bacteroidales bacterium]|nr:16S rRNA (adenine(1518)-N(6)/adenine(1519)-N(6))-dimethyltransferase RsmA [Bacteroidales bacterium]HRX95446.1 16S rRNA (adenine(1518)-N(6)/adenine(1519)-N(6))-dimethyltransferase RsmA [Bacteroidales bacterium]